MRAYDMTGQRFGRLVAIEATGKRNLANNRIWLFKCDCGEMSERDGYDVRRGKFSACQKCGAGKIGLANVTHGKSGTEEFRIWTNIQTRCYNQKSISYPSYGGRGITMCDRWRGSFQAFLDDVGRRPPGTSIDRQDNDGNYEPGNCKWATTEEQANNRRTNIRVTIGQETKTLSQWASQSGLPAPMVIKRHSVGYREGDLLQPHKKGPILVTINGLTRNLTEWAQIAGLRTNLLSQRFKRGVRGAELIRESKKVVKL